MVEPAKPAQCLTVPLRQVHHPMGKPLGPWPSGSSCGTDVSIEQMHTCTAVCPVHNTAGAGPALLRLTKQKYMSMSGTETY